MSWVVIVSEERNRALTGSGPVDYESPGHDSRDEALLLVELLNGSTPAGDGPWRHAIAGGQRTVGLRHQANSDTDSDERSGGGCSAGTVGEPQRARDSAGRDDPAES